VLSSAVVFINEVSYSRDIKSLAVF